MDFMQNAKFATYPMIVLEMADHGLDGGTMAHLRRMAPGDTRGLASCRREVRSRVSANGVPRKAALKNSSYMVCLADHPLQLSDLHSHVRRRDGASE